MTTAIVATGTAVVTKLVENIADNTGGKLGKAFCDATAKVMKILKQENPDAMMVIKPAPELPLDYGKAVLEIESAAKNNPQLAQAMQELAAAAKAEPHPKLDEVLEEIKGALKSQQSKIENYGKVAEEIKAEKGAMVGQKF